MELTRRLQRGRLIAPSPALGQYEDLQTRIQITAGYLSGHPWEQFTLPRATRRGETLFSPAGCGPVACKDHVVTIHDLTTLDHPSWYSRSFAMWYSQLLPALVRRARMLVTVSEFCKERLIQLLRVKESKIVVAGEAAADCFRPRALVDVEEARRRFNIHGPYFLAVGAISARKNFARLLRVWKTAGPDLEGTQLVIVGKPQLRFAAESQLHDLAAGAFHLTGVDDDDLSRLYSGAAGLLYPSLYEGFGLPILEAMACGCPVLTSNCTAMPEVSGNAAVLVDPLSEQSILDGMKTLLRKRNELKRRGFERAAAFSWDRTATLVERTLLS